MHAAAGRPAAGFIGVEPFVNGIAKLMSALRSGSARQSQGLWRRCGPRSSTGCRRRRSIAIDLLYPDPWPKKRHWKRRFVGEANLDRFARVIMPGGTFRFASDMDSYVNWTLLLMQGTSRFCLAGDELLRLARAVSRLAGHPLRGQGAARRAAAGLSHLYARRRSAGGPIGGLKIPGGSTISGAYSWSV